MNQVFEYMRPKDLCKLYPISIGALRFLLHKRKENGLDLCVRKVGRLILIRKDLFQDWIESHGVARLDSKKN